MKHKVVELSMVTDETLEEALNHWTDQGWKLDAIHFAMREGSRRPSMAFIVFVEDEDGPLKPESDQVESGDRSLS